MRGVVPGVLLLVGLLGWSPPAVLAARSLPRGKTIKDLSDTIPLGVLKRSVTPKLYQSLLVSPLDDWSIVRGRVAGTRLSDARVIRSSMNPACNSLAPKFAKELTLAAKDSTARARPTDSVLFHLLIYKIADGVMAVSFAYPEAPARQQVKSFGNVRLLVKTKEGHWTEIRPLETREDKRWSLRERGGRRLWRMDRMPMDASSAPPR